MKADELPDQLISEISKTRESKDRPSEDEQSPKFKRFTEKLEATNRWQSLTFNERRRCVWRVSAQRNSRVRLILEEAKYRCDEACSSFVEIKHSADFQTTGFRSCCGEHAVETISDGNQVLIIHDARELNRNGVFSLRFTQAHNSTAKTSTCAFNN
ncbi:Metalloendopeptidase [Aphelenchoides besseyi]|nr:Metalloendopeptidase [Aphelenchoides besseyi]